MEDCEFEVEIEMESAMDTEMEQMILQSSRQIRQSQFPRNRQPGKGIFEEVSLNLDWSELQANFKKDVVRHVPGREQEAREIFQFILNSENGASAPLSLHGNTGCGKTSLVLKILELFKKSSTTVSTAYINCMSMQSTKQVYNSILSKLFNARDRKPQILLPIHLKQGDANTKIVVLDQIDQFQKNQQFLYNVLQWLTIPNSKLVLILITNVIDLTQKLSHKLQSRMKFTSIIFKPYSAEQIQKIAFIKYPKILQICQRNAVTFISKKIANINSDIRILKKIYAQMINQHTYGQSKKQQLLSIQQVSQFFYGQSQIPQILKDYEIIIKILHNVEKKCQISEQIFNKMFLKHSRRYSTQQIWNLLSEMQECGLLSIVQHSRNGDVAFLGHWIKITEYLHSVAPEQDERYLM